MLNDRTNPRPDAAPYLRPALEPMRYIELVDPDRVMVALTERAMGSCLGFSFDVMQMGDSAITEQDMQMAARRAGALAVEAAVAAVQRIEQLQPTAPKGHK